MSMIEKGLPPSLDPEIVRLLAAMARHEVDFEGLGAADYRAHVKALLPQGPPIEDVASVTDLVVPSEARGIPIRIYEPRGDTRGALIFLHGSGFVVHGLDSHDHECRVLANRAGTVVVAVDYSLAPEHKFPSAVHDCISALRWVADMASLKGGRALPLGIAGDSAGGNLAAVAALAARDSDGPELALQVLIYPVIDLRCHHPSYFENASGFGLTAQQMRWFVAQYVRTDADRWDPRATPILASSLEGLPRTHVITAQYDPLRDEGEDYAARLRAAGVPVSMTRYEGVIHGVFHMSRLVKAGRQMLGETADVIRAAFTK